MGLVESRLFNVVLDLVSLSFEMIDKLHIVGMFESLRLDFSALHHFDIDDLVRIENIANGRYWGFPIHSIPTQILCIYFLVFYVEWLNSRF